MLAIIVEYLNYCEAINSLENGESRSSKRNHNCLQIYDDIANDIGIKPKIYNYGKIAEEDRKYFANEKIIGNEKSPSFQINDIPILLDTWNSSRIIDNFKNINDDNKFDGESYSYNIENYYLSPMNIIICDGGNHSQFAARFKHEGKTIIKYKYDYSSLYDQIFFDGLAYRRKDDNNSPIKMKYEQDLLFYSGVIFELGRHLLKYQKTDC